MLPPLTHLQFYILTILLDSKQSGREVRARLKNDHHVKQSLASFYQLMSRMEEAGMIEGEYKITSIERQGIRTRYYKALGHGIQCRDRTLDFYVQAAPARLQPEVGR